MCLAPGHAHRCRGGSRCRLPGGTCCCGTGPAGSRGTGCTGRAAARPPLASGLGGEGDVSSAFSPCPRAAPAGSGVGRGPHWCWVVSASRLSLSQRLPPAPWLYASSWRQRDAPADAATVERSLGTGDGGTLPRNRAPRSPRRTPAPSACESTEEFGISQRRHGAGLAAGQSPAGSGEERGGTTAWGQAAPAKASAGGGERSAATGPQRRRLRVGFGAGQSVRGSGAAGAGPRGLVLPGHHRQPGRGAGAGHGLLRQGARHRAAVAAPHLHQ